MKTVEDLRDALRGAGKDPDAVGRPEDPNFPQIEGVTLVRRLEDGGCAVSILGRGYERHRELFGSEAEAIAAIAPRFLRSRPVRHVDEAERARSKERMQARSRETLQRIEARRRRDEAGS